MKRLVALCAGALVITAAAAATSGGTGLYGKAIISPASPVCQEGVPCSKPAKGFRLRFFRGTTHVADARTDAAGRFRIALAPGIYRIGAPTLRVVYPHIQPRTATVPRGRYAHVVLTIDLGIR